MRSAVRVANELGYSKVGLYANSSTTKRISQEYQSKGTSLANENTILWLAGGPNYLTSSYVEAKRAERNEENQERKANNESTIDTPLGQEIGFAIEDLEEQENTSFEGVIPAIRQVGNYVNNTGAANSDGVADYNYLYSDNLFGNDAFGETPDSNPNTIESTIKSVDDYRNVTNLLPSVLAHPDGALLGAITSYVFLLWTKQRFNKFFKKRDLIAPSTVVAIETIKLAKNAGAALKRARR